MVRSVNTRVIPVAAYSMNICKFTDGELKELDHIIKEDGGRRIKSLRDIYKETRLRVACYMTCLQNKWIKFAWRRDQGGEFNNRGSKKDNGRC